MKPEQHRSKDMESIRRLKHASEFHEGTRGLNTDGSERLPGHAAPDHRPAGEGKLSSAPRSPVGEEQILAWLTEPGLDD
jgi:hypothetical protein